MKFVLEPGQPIKIIFEPWNHELICHRSLYTGNQSAEVRIWGRRRILVLERLIPIARSVQIHLLGTGMPSFYNVDLGEMNFTLGLSGWTANDWSRMGHFDLMAPRKEVSNMVKKQVFEALKQNWRENVPTLASRLSLPMEEVEAALTAWVQAGRVMYDLHGGVYRVRELSREPLPISQLRFSDPREAEANQLLEQAKIPVKVSSDLAGNHSLSGTIRQSGQKWETSITLDNEQRMIGGSCTCGYYIQNKLHRGPCPHMLALRMKYEKGRKTIFSFQ